MSDLSRAIHKVSTYIDCQGYLKEFKVTRNYEAYAAASRVADGKYQIQRLTNTSVLGLRWLAS
jgi:hypothetical protein